MSCQWLELKCKKEKRLWLLGVCGLCVYWFGICDWDICLIRVVGGKRGHLRTQILQKYPDVFDEPM